MARTDSIPSSSISMMIWFIAMVLSLPQTCLESVSKAMMQWFLNIDGKRRARAFQHRKQFIRDTVRYWKCLSILFL